MIQQNGLLYHQTLPGKTPTQKALLEDYAFLMDALIEGYEKTYDKSYLTMLDHLAKQTLEKFYKEGVWYLSDDDIGAVADFDDRYYTAALSTVMEDFVQIASLGEDLDLLVVVKKTLKSQGAVLENNPSFASKLLEVFLRVTLGDVIIKSNLHNLRAAQSEINAMPYPFVLTKTEESDKYLACRVNSCFAYDKNITVLIEKINKMVK